MKCPYCDSIIKKSKFCSECGKEIETGLSTEQKIYLKRKSTGHKIGAVAGSVVGGASVGVGIFGVIIGVILIIFGVLLSLTIIGAIIGIPLIIIGAGMLGIGGGLSIFGGLGVREGMRSGRKAEEIDDELRGIKKK